MDWTMDWIMDWIMDSILDRTQTKLTFPGLPTVQYLIGSSLVSRVSIYRFLCIFFGIEVSI